MHFVIKFFKGHNSINMSTVAWLVWHWLNSTIRRRDICHCVLQWATAVRSSLQYLNQFRRLYIDRYCRNSGPHVLKSSGSAAMLVPFVTLALSLVHMATIMCRRIVAIFGDTRRFRWQSPNSATVAIFGVFASVVRALGILVTLLISLRNCWSVV